jgi:hypothetical protein
VQDLEVVVDIPALATTEIFGKYEVSPGRSYSMFWNATQVGGRWSPDGTANKSRVGDPVTTTGRHIVRTVLDIPGGALSYFWDGTPAGSSVVTPESVNVSTTPLQVGALNLGTNSIFTGDVYRAVLRNGDGGPIVAQLDPGFAPFPDGPVVNGSTFTSSDGRVWTINGNGVSFTSAVPNAPDLIILRKGRKISYNQDLGFIRPRP